MGNFHLIDIIFIILTLLMIVHGYIRGFITELFSWASLAVAILVAFFLHPNIALFIRGSFMPDVRYVPELLAFLGVFVIALVICKLLELILKNVVTGASLGGLNKLLGAIFGFIEGVAIAALILFVLNVQPFFDVSSIMNESIFAEILLPAINRIPLEMGRDVQNIAVLYEGLKSV